MLLCVRRLEAQQGTYWVVPDSELAVGALRTYQEGGKCGDGIHHLHSHTPGAEHLSPRCAIKVVVTPSHRIASIDVWVDAATREEPRVDLTWMQRRPYAYLPQVQYRNHCQLAATDLQEWLQEQPAVPARVHYKHSCPWTDSPAASSNT